MSISNRQVPLSNAATHGYLPEGGADVVHCALDAPTTSYFRVLEMRLLKGRLFEDSDRRGAPAVAVINRSAAELSWPGQDPIGKRLSFDAPNPDATSWITIVGLVEDVRNSGLEAEPLPQGDARGPYGCIEV